MTCIMKGCNEAGLFRFKIDMPGVPDLEGLLCANHREKVGPAHSIAASIELANNVVTDWEAKVWRLQRIIRIANGQLEPNYAPVTAFAAVAYDPELLAEAQEALERPQQPLEEDPPFCIACGQALPK